MKIDMTMGLSAVLLIWICFFTQIPVYVEMYARLLLAQPNCPARDLMQKQGMSALIDYEQFRNILGRKKTRLQIESVTHDGIDGKYAWIVAFKNKEQRVLFVPREKAVALEMQLDKLSIPQYVADANYAGRSAIGMVLGGLLVNPSVLLAPSVSPPRR